MNKTDGPVLVGEVVRLPDGSTARVVGTHFDPDHPDVLQVSLEVRPLVPIRHVTNMIRCIAGEHLTMLTGEQHVEFRPSHLTLHGSNPCGEIGLAPHDACRLPPGDPTDDE